MPRKAASQHLWQSKTQVRDALKSCTPRRRGDGLRTATEPTRTVAAARRINCTGRGTNKTCEGRPPRRALDEPAERFMLREQHLPKERVWPRRVLPGEARGLLGVAGEPLGGQTNNKGVSHDQKEEPTLAPELT